MITAVLFSLVAAFPVTIRVDAGQPLGELAPIWRFFGGDEPNYATMKDGRKLLVALGELKPRSVYFRTHNLLNTGDGTPALKWGSTNAYTEDAQGRPVYDWTIVDRIFDTYLERGVRPYVQIGFMPKALSRKPEPYQHEWRPGLPYDDIYTGWAYPPKDYAKWEELVYQWVRHCLERYGREEVSTWYWEIWNEANIGYWQGTFEEFLKLHDHAVAGVRRALPEARVGGPDMAGSDPKFLRPFLEHMPRQGHAPRLRLLPRQGLAHVRGRPRPDGHRRPARDDRPGLPDDRVVPGAEADADRDRRVRPGRLRRLPGAAARLSQRHDVLELHGRELRAQARPGAAARRQPRGRAHVGVRVRGPALLRRLPRAGHQRHPPAGAERLPHVLEDGRAAGGGARAPPRSRSTRSSPTACAGRPTSRPSRASSRTGSR